VTATVAVPTITSASAASVSVNSRFNYAILASNSPTNYNALGLPTGLTVDQTTGIISGNPTKSGTSNVTISATNANGTGSATLRLTVAPIGTVLPAANVSTISANAHLANLSIRSSAGISSDTLITGFVVAGGSKNLLIRGIGPSLAQFGVSGFLPDPELGIYSGSTEILSDVSWEGNADLAQAFTQVGAFALLPTSSDSAVLSSFDPGAYTAQITSVSGDDGIALAEIYDADPAGSPSRLINLSALTEVGTGPNVLIAGFSISGTGTETILIRGIGPSLTSFGVNGVLSNPELTIVDSQGNVVASNSGWGGDPTLSSVFAQVGAFALPTDSADSAIVVTLPAGSYTARLDGANQTTGKGLLEIYNVP
jgi:hypothetical protein